MRPEREPVLNHIIATHSIVGNSTGEGEYFFFSFSGRELGRGEFFLFFSKEVYEREKEEGSCTGLIWRKFKKKLGKRSG